MLFLLIKYRCEPSAPEWMHIGQDWSTHARTGTVSTRAGRALKHPSSSTLVTGPLHILTSYAGPQKACAHRAMQTSTDHILPFAATWMDLEGVMLSEKKSDRERRTPLYVESKQKTTEKELIDTENKLAVTRSRGGGWKSG